MTVYMNHPDSNIVEISIKEDISSAESAKIETLIKSDMEKMGKIRVLQNVYSPYGTDPSAFWQDARFVLANDNSFSHIAVVTDADWLKRLVQSTGRTLSAEVKVFERSQIDEARTWLKNA